MSVVFASPAFAADAGGGMTSLLASFTQSGRLDVVGDWPFAYLDSQPADSSAGNVPVLCRGDCELLHPGVSQRLRLSPIWGFSGFGGFYGIFNFVR